jgi:hypothetical protein
MPKIQLPDGSERQFDQAVTGLAIADAMRWPCGLMMTCGI